MYQTFLNYVSFLLLFVVLSIGCKPLKDSTTAQKQWAKYYQEHLTPGAQLVSANPVSTLEYYKGRYILKEYFYDTKTLTALKFYKNSALTQPDSLFTIFTDSGRKLSEENYVNGRKEGESLEYHYMYGYLEKRLSYKGGKLDGQMLTYNKNGQIKEKATYRQDSLHGERIYYDSTGHVTKTQIFEYGKLISANPVEDDPQEQSAPKFQPCSSEHPAENEVCGDKAIFKYLSTVHYPASARNLGIQGKVLVYFVVDKDGAVRDVAVVRGLCQDISDECYRLISNMPKWTPGMCGDQPVKVLYKLPLNFKLQ